VSGADPCSIQPIYNGIHTPSFGVSPFEPVDPTITWVGRIDPLKDVKTLLREFVAVRESIPNARLRIFGGTPRGNDGYHRECVDLRDSLGLADGATFEGRGLITDVPRRAHRRVGEHLRRLSVFRVEAMASGRA
jgi:glycosyltransferase involved in cell wall biosynthesis